MCLTSKNRQPAFPVVQRIMRAVFASSVLFFTQSSSLARGTAGTAGKPADAAPREMPRADALHQEMPIWHLSTIGMSKCTVLDLEQPRSRRSVMGVVLTWLNKISCVHYLGHRHEPRLLRTEMILMNDDMVEPSGMTLYDDCQNNGWQLQNMLDSHMPLINIRRPSVDRACSTITTQRFQSSEFN